MGSWKAAKRRTDLTVSIPLRAAATDPKLSRPTNLPLTGLDGWLRRQERRQRRVVTLEDALIGGRASAYALYRLRFFLLRCACAAALHILRLGLLRFIFSHRTFLITLVLYAVANCAGSMWWGALEVLRGRVRSLSRDGEARRIPGEIGRWLTVAVALAIVCLLLPAIWVGGDVGIDGRRFTVFHLYAIVIGARLGLDLVTLTFHSGIYAVRRVYRPLLALVGVELGGFAAVLALWPLLGSWSFPIAMLLGGALSALFTFRYAAPLYHLFGWLPLRLERPALRSLRSSQSWRTIGECLVAGTAYALLKMDAFLMLALFRWHNGAMRDVTLFMLFVSISPVVQAGFDWAQLLYFDLKRLSDQCLAGLRRRYEKLAVRLAWVMGLALWGLACLLATAVMRRRLGEVYWDLAPFVIGRSLLAQVQIRAFAKQRYGVLLGSGALLLALIIASQVGLATERSRLFGLATASFAVAALLRRLEPRTEEESNDSRVVSVTAWLQRLSKIGGPVRIQSLRFAHWADLMPRTERNLRDGVAENRWRQTRMARRIAKQLRGHGAVTVIHPDQIVWYETPPVPASMGAKALLRWGGGLVETIEQTPFGRNGRDALQEASDSGVIGHLPVHGSSAVEAPRSLDQVQGAFRETIPQGIVCGPDLPTPPWLRSISSEDRRSIFTEAVYFANNLCHSERRCRFDVTSFVTGGELKLIFITDRNSNRNRRRRWRATIRACNVAAALADSSAGARNDRRKAADKSGKASYAD
jgi:hypothetical protein